MHSGLGAARYWNNHFMETAKRARECAKALQDQRAAEIREQFPAEYAKRPDAWSLWYDWAHAIPELEVQLRRIHEHHGSSADVFEHWRAIVAAADDGLATLRAAVEIADQINRSE